MKKKALKRSEVGSVVVEAALVLPILFMCLAGLFEFSRIFNIQQSLTNAAREGARAAALELDDTEAVTVATNISQNYLARTGVDTKLTTIQPNFSSVDGIETVEVTIGFDYISRITAWVPGIEHIMLRSRSVMRREA